MDDKTKLVLVRCARVYTSTKNWVKAISEYENLRKEFPEDPYIVEPLAKSYYEIGDKMKAKELYEHVKQIYINKGEEQKAERVKRDMDLMFPPGT